MNKLALATIAALGTLAGAAHAVTVAPPSTVGTGAVVLLGVAGGGVTSIDVGTTFTSVVSLFSNGTDDFAGIGSLTAVSPLSLTATLGSAVGFSSGFGSFSGAVTAVEATGPATNRVVNVFAQGTFTPSGTLANFAPGGMSLSFSATQNQPGGSISASYSFSSPAALVPEPETYAMLLAGLGAVGLLARRRRGN